MDPDFVKPVAIHLDRDPAVLTLDLTGGRPSVTVMIGGKGPFLFIVDTGAGASLIDSTLAAQLELSVTGDAHVHSPGGAGPQELAVVLAPRIELSGVTLSSVSLIRSDLRARFGQNFQGVLSYRTLGNVLVTLDYSRKELRLASGKLEKGLPFTIPFRIGPGPIIVTSTGGTARSGQRPSRVLHLAEGFHVQAQARGASPGGCANQDPYRYYGKLECSAQWQHQFGRDRIPES